MTKNGLYIQTISTKRTDFQADRVLLLGEVTEKKEKAHPSHFLKFLFVNPHCTHLVLANPQADTSQNQKSAFFAKEVFFNKEDRTRMFKFFVQHAPKFEAALKKPILLLSRKNNQEYGTIQSRK